MCANDELLRVSERVSGNKLKGTNLQLLRVHQWKTNVSKFSASLQYNCHSSHILICRKLSFYPNLVKFIITGMVTTLLAMQVQIGQASVTLEGLGAL